MNPCSDWREVILDRALGLPASEALLEHLEACAACAETLAKLQRRAEELDDGVRDLVTVDPPPHLRHQVMARVSSAPSGNLWRANWRLSLTAVAVTILLAAAAYVLRWRVEARQQEQRLSSIATALSQWRSPTDSLLRSPADPLLKAVPRLGEAYFELRPNSVPPKSEKGEENAD